MKRLSQCESMDSEVHIPLHEAESTRKSRSKQIVLSSASASASASSLGSGSEAVLSTAGNGNGTRIGRLYAAQKMHCFMGIIISMSISIFLSSTVAVGFILHAPIPSLIDQRKVQRTSFILHRSWKCQDARSSSSKSSTLTATTEQGQGVSPQEEQEPSSTSSSTPPPPPPSQPDAMISKFKSYASNISRTRNPVKSIKVQHRHQYPSHSYKPGHGGQEQSERELKQRDIHVSPDPASRAAIRSLIYMLRNESRGWRVMDGGHLQKEGMGIGIGIGIMDMGACTIDNKAVMDELRETMNRAIIQAIRAASDHGDYNMIATIVDAAVEYARAMGMGMGGGTRNHILLLETRLFGEAISEMSRTKARDSKLKKVWNLFVDLGKGEHDGGESGLLTAKPSAFELNAMILALGSRGKVRAAIELHKEYTSGKGVHGMKIEPDNYTASALLTILADSIAANNAPVNIQKAAKGSPCACWQWNEAVEILNSFEGRMKLNNRVYAAALKVNEEAMELYKFAGNKHPGAKVAMSILERMQKQNVSPDVVTCSAVMSAFDKSKQWKAALALLKAMEKGEKSSDETTVGTSDWKLPLPNVYTYASVISSCARGGRYDEALEILDQIRGRSFNVSSEASEESFVEDKEMATQNVIVPNIWVYNSALAACVPQSNNHIGTNSIDRFETATQILRRMEEDAAKGFDTPPDKISYNTALAAIAGINNNGRKSNENIDLFSKTALENGSDFHGENQARMIIDEMTKKQIKRDPVTYRNAITACGSNPESALRILELAFADNEIFDISDDEWDSPDTIRVYLINIALKVCAASGEMELIAKLFWRLKDLGLEPDSNSMLSLIKGISASGHSEDSMMALNAMKGDGAANAQVVEKYGIDIVGGGIGNDIPMIEERHYTSAIMGCLRNGELFPALKILNAMKLHGLEPNPTSLQGLIMAYCKLATDEASLEIKNARKEYSKRKKKGPGFKADHSISRTRSTAALAMMNTMKDAPIKLKSVVASACAATGMWFEAREILWSIHIAAVLEKKRELSIGAVDLDQGSAIAELPKLHRSLLKLCARSGNITASLWYADAIQDLNAKFERGGTVTDSSRSLSNVTDPEMVLDAWDSNITSISLPHHGIAMTGEDWKLVMIAASKSAHWRVCLGTLPFIQPFVEATHPRLAVSGDNETGPSITSLNKEYEKISRALTAAVLAFETRSQYAWASRAIDDWIEWSGRRPPREAIFSACRSMAVRGKGNGVVSLVTKVLSIPDEMNIRSGRPKVLTYDTCYEMAVYIEAITALYKNGLYDSADELYVKAISQGFLPWAIIGESTQKDSILKIDLHGMNRGVAHSAVRVSLQHLIQSKNIEKMERDVLIVTGRGKNSQQHLRPILRPEVQRMLVEEFYPPLGSSTAPKNTGALKVSVTDVNAWIEHQEQQRGIRFLAVAETLKTITTGSRLKQLLKRKIESPTDDDSPPPVVDKDSEQV